MKIKEKKELFTKTIDELKSLLKESRNELFDLKLALSQKKLKNTKEVFWKRKKIAMILTAIREKDLALVIAEKPAEGEGK
ncbi:MAG: 50S ribosomal protein L29 [Patescibacteria group bacterium]